MGAKIIRTAPYRQPEEDPRIFATGFYDETGTWFYTWESHRQGEEYCYSLADVWGAPEAVIRYRHLQREGAGEITLSEYMAKGLPA